MEHTHFSVGGMTCGGCAKSVERALTALPGVGQASVDLASASVHVDFDAQKTSPAQLKAAVAEAGFET